MFDLFTRSYQLPPTRAFSIKKYSRFDYVKRMYQHELARVKDYYNHRERGELNNHLLSRLITLCNPNIELSEMGYRASVRSDYIYATRQLGMVSNISKGTYYENLFYTDNAIDVLYIVENEIDWFNLSTNWRNYAPIRCVYHESTDLDMYAMFNTKALENTSLFVYEIDVVLLMVQYRFWALERIEAGMSINPTRFLAMFVYPNMMDNMLDISIFNRFLTISKGEDIKPFEYDHPFHIMNFTKDVDRILTEINSLYNNEEVYIEQLLLTIPAVSSDNMDQVLKLHKQFYTRQSEWIIWITRTNYIVDLLKFLGKKGIARNRDELYYLPAKIRQLENRSTMVNLPGQLLNKLDKATQEIKVTLGKR